MEARYDIDTFGPHSKTSGDFLSMKGICPLLQAAALMTKGQPRLVSKDSYIWAELTSAGQAGG